MILSEFIQELILETVAVYKAQILVSDNLGRLLGYAHLPITEAKELLKQNFESSEKYISGFYVKRVIDENALKLRYIIFVKAKQNSEILANMLSFKLCKILSFLEYSTGIELTYKRILHDKEIDIKKIIKNIRIPYEMSRIVIVINTHKNVTIKQFERAQKAFDIKQDEVIFLMKYNQIVVIKKSESKNPTEYLIDLSKKYLRKEKGRKFCVGIGCISKDISTLHISYKAAKLSADTILTFNSDEYVQSYERLGLKRLILSIPSSVKRDCICHFFNIDSLDALDAKEMKILDSYIENRGNIEATAYVTNVRKTHIKKLTNKYEEKLGGKFQNFETASKFKLGMLLFNSLKSGL